MTPIFDLNLLLTGTYHDWLVAGLITSLSLTGISLALALPLAILIAVIRLSPVKLLQWSGFAFVEAIRNVEATSAITALTLYTAAYMSEDVRSGIRSIPGQQFEAARTLGFSYLGAMRLVILPQVVRNMLPSLVNQFVATIKETSLG